MEKLMAPRDNEVDDETREKVKTLCGDYLGGYWYDVDANKLKIKRIAQGYVNEIYLVQLPADDERCAKELYQSVVIKLFGGFIKEGKYNLNLLQIYCSYVMAGDEGLGPKILGVDTSGLISEYFEGRNYNMDDEMRPEVVALLARKLAKLHSMKMPFHKTKGLTLIKQLTGDEPEAEGGDEFTNLYEEGLKKDPDTDKRIKVDVLRNVDIKAEMKWAGKMMVALDSPMVFSHADFNRGNILVSDRPLDIRFVDFDYSGFNFRGYDIGRYFATWRQEDMLFGFSRYPTDEEMEEFIGAYIEESAVLLGNDYKLDPKNSIDVIRREAKVHTLFAYLVDSWFLCFQSIANPKAKDEMLDKAKTRFGGYLTLKQQFIDENSLPKVD